MKFMKSMSLSTQLNIPSVVAGICLIIAATALQFASNQATLDERARANLETVKDTILIATETDASAANLTRVISSIATNPEITKIRLLRQGHVAASNRHEEIGQNIVATLSDDKLKKFQDYEKNGFSNHVTEDTENQLILFDQIQLIDPSINRIRPYTIQIHYDISNIRQHYARQAFYTALIIGFGIVLMLLSNYLTQRQILTRRLRLAIDALDSQKDRNELVLLPTEGSDELAKLGESYNQLQVENSAKKQELISTQKYIDSTTNSVPFMLLYIDRDGDIKFSNQQFVDWIELSKTIIHESNVHDIPQLETILEADFDNEIHTLETVLPSVNGDFKQYRCVITPSFNEESYLIGHVLSIQDITKEKRDQDKLQQYAQQLEFKTWQLEDSNEIAEASVKAKSEFLANMSHEIRTPMNGVLGMAQILLKTELNDEQQRHIRTIIDSGKSLLTIINDILDFSKIEAGKIDLESLEFNPLKLIESVGDQIYPLAFDKGLALYIQPSEEIDCTIIGDTGRLRQVLLNLLSNAIKFTHEGCVAMRTDIHNEGTQCVLSISVMDSGIGIPEDKINHIFEEFSQSDASTTREYGGTGLGLTISKKLCQLMGGDLTASSIVGEGSTFTMSCQFDIAKKHVYSGDSQDFACIIFDDNDTRRQTIAMQLDSQAYMSQEFASGESLENFISSNQDDHNAVLIAGIAIPESLIPRVKASQLRVIHYGVKDPLDYPHSSMAEPIKPSVLFKEIQPQSAETAEPISHAAIDAAPHYEARVLLVEDNMVNQQVASIMLEDMGITVDIAANGEESIEMLEKFSYDLVLMDCQMPVMDGYQATQAIRASDKDYAGIIIVAMTANAMEGDREKCINAGMSDYVPKPIEDEKLEAMLSKWLPQINPTSALSA